MERGMLHVYLIEQLINRLPKGYLDNLNALQAEYAWSFVQLI
jgi:hypothetical protein